MCSGSKAKWNKWQQIHYFNCWHIFSFLSKIYDGRRLCLRMWPQKWLMDAFSLGAHIYWLRFCFVFYAVSSLSAYAEHMQYNLGQDWAADVVITNQKRLDTEMKRTEIFHFGNLYSSGAVCYTNPAISGTRYHGINVLIVHSLHLHSSRSLCLPLLFSASWDFINLAKCLDK